MKRVAAALMALLLLTCMAAASAGTAGSSSNPLITLSYLNGEYSTELRKDVGAAIDDRLNQAYNASITRLNELYRDYVGYRFAARNTEIVLTEGKKLTMITGSSFFLLSGSASLYISSGSVVNASTGFEVSSGSLLTLYQRYFCAENTVAVVTASTDAYGQVDGFYTTDGVVNPSGTVFNDVKRTDWFYPAVDYVYNNGLFAGTSAESFTPGAPMTRAMFVTVLHRLAGNPAVSSANRFTDVTDPALYYYIPVVWASENGVAAGMGDNTFVPDNSITREQMAVIMYRYAEYKGYDLSQGGTTFDAFRDKNSVSEYAINALRWATARGIINGTDGLLLPSGTATRAQVAQIIYNFTQHVNEAAG